MTPAEQIIETVARAWGLTVPELRDFSTQVRRVTEPRQVALWLLMELLNLSGAEAGPVVGYRTDDSTRPRRYVQNMRDTDRKFRAKLEAVTTECRAQLQHDQAA